MTNQQLIAFILSELKVNMKFEKLEQRCVMDGAGFGGFCTAFDGPDSTASTSIDHEVYGPMKLVESVEAASGTLIGDKIYLSKPLTMVDYSGPVTEVVQLNINGAVLVGKQEVPASTGVRAALDILEAYGGYVQAWANDGINGVYRSGETYYFEFQTPHEEFLALGTRAIFVNIGDGAIHEISRW